jgi:hypothetical protein
MTRSLPDRIKEEEEKELKCLYDLGIFANTC